MKQIIIFSDSPTAGYGLRSASAESFPAFYNKRSIRQALITRSATLESAEIPPNPQFIGLKMYYTLRMCTLSKTVNPNIQILPADPKQ